MSELLTGTQEVARISQHLVDGRRKTIHPCSEGRARKHALQHRPTWNPATTRVCHALSLQPILGRTRQFPRRSVLQPLPRAQPNEPCLRRQPTLGNASLFDVLRPGGTPLTTALRGFAEGVSTVQNGRMGSVFLSSKAVESRSKLTCFLVSQSILAIAFLALHARLAPK